MKMIRLVLAILIAVTVCGTGVAQAPAPLTIEKVSWRDANLASTSPWDRQAPFSIDVKNTTQKTIATVHWDIYVIDNSRQLLFDHFKFVTNDKPIQPGKKIRLTKRIDSYVTPTYASARAVIRRIVYSDGSAWNNPAKMQD